MITHSSPIFEAVITRVMAVRLIYAA